LTKGFLTPPVEFTSVELLSPLRRPLPKELALGRFLGEPAANHPPVIGGEEFVPKLLSLLSLGERRMSCMGVDGPVIFCVALLVPGPLTAIT